MKLALYDAGCADGTVYRQIIEHLPLDPRHLQADANILVIAYRPNYRFLDDVYKVVTKPWILFDFTEFGWDWPGRSHLDGNRWGIDNAPKAASHFDTDEWRKLDDFIRENPPALTFKRELLEIHRTETLLPVEWLCTQDIPPIQSKEDFDARPIEVFHCWGYSNPARVKLHADIFMAMTNRGIEVISEPRHWHQMPKTANRVWASIYAPWFSRVPLHDVLQLQQQSKISVSMPGAGIKCFRTTGEAPLGCIMAMPFDNLAWSYRWIEGENCLKMSTAEPLQDLMFHVERPDLYSAYVEGQRNLANYQCQTYVNDYLLPAIRKIL